MISKKLSDIRPKDLLFVILYAIVLPILFGVLLGLVDYYMRTLWSFTFASLLFWLIAINTGKMVRRQYKNPHIIYSIIACIGMLFAAVIIYTLPFYYAMNGVALGNLFDLRVYWSVFISVMNPLNWIANFSLDFAIWLIIIVVGTYLGVKKTLH